MIDLDDNDLAELGTLKPAATAPARPIVDLDDNDLAELNMGAPKMPQQASDPQLQAASTPDPVMGSGLLDPYKKLWDITTNPAAARGFMKGNQITSESLPEGKRPEATIFGKIGEGVVGGRAEATMARQNLANKLFGLEGESAQDAPVTQRGNFAERVAQGFGGAQAALPEFVAGGKLLGPIAGFIGGGAYTSRHGQTPTGMATNAVTGAVLPFANKLVPKRLADSAVAQQSIGRGAAGAIGAGIGAAGRVVEGEEQPFAPEKIAEDAVLWGLLHKPGQVKRPEVVKETETLTPERRLQIEAEIEADIIREGHADPQRFEVGPSGGVLDAANPNFPKTPPKLLPAPQKLLPAPEPDAWTSRRNELTRMLDDAVASDEWQAVAGIRAEMTKLDQLKGQYGFPERVPQPQHNTPAEEFAPLSDKVPLRSPFPQKTAMTDSLARAESDPNIAKWDKWLELAEARNEANTDAMARDIAGGLDRIAAKQQAIEAAKAQEARDQANLAKWDGWLEAKESEPQRPGVPVGESEIPPVKMPEPVAESGRIQQNPVESGGIPKEPQTVAPKSEADILAEQEALLEQQFPTPPEPPVAPKAKKKTPDIATTEDMPRGVVEVDAIGNYITKTPDGWYKVWRHKGTHATLAGTINYRGENGLLKAKERLRQLSEGKPAPQVVKQPLTTAGGKKGKLPFVKEPTPTDTSPQTEGVAPQTASEPIPPPAEVAQASKMEQPDRRTGFTPSQTEYLAAKAKAIALGEEPVKQTMKVPGDGNVELASKDAANEMHRWLTKEPATPDKWDHRKSTEWRRTVSQPDRRARMPLTKLPPVEIPTNGAEPTPAPAAKKPPIPKKKAVKGTFAAKDKGFGTLPSMPDWLRKKPAAQPAPEVLTPRKSMREIASERSLAMEELARQKKASKRLQRFPETAPDMTQPVDRTEKYAGSVNVKRFTEENPGLEDTLRRIYDENPDVVDEYRRMVRTFDDIAESARKSPVNKWDANKVAAMKPGAILNDADAHALDNQMLGKIQAAREGTGTWQEARAYFNASSGVASETGRALGARRMMRIAAVQKLAAADKAAVQLFDLYKTAGKELPESVLEGLKKYKPDDWAGVADYYASHARKLSGDKLHSYIYGNLLSSPMTHLLNTASNISRTLDEIAVDTVRVPMDIALSKATGKARDVYAKEPLKYAAALVSDRLAWSEASRKFMFAMRHGFNEDAAKTLAIKQVGLGGGMKNPINLGPRALLAADEFIKHLSVNAKLASDAYHNAMKDATAEGVKGKALKARVAQLTATYMQSPTDAMVKAAKSHAERMTYQEPLPQTMQQLQGILNKKLPQSVPVVGGKLAPGKLVQPFFHIIYNVWKQQIMHSPLGFATLASKNLTKAEGTRRAAKALIGTALILPLYEFAKSGGVTGGAPKDPAEKATYFGSGKKAYSVKIGGRWVDWRLFGPLAMPFAIAAALNDAEKKKAKRPDTNKLLTAFGEVGKLMMESSFLAGANSLMDALTDPESFGPRFLANMASQVVPLSAAQRFTTNLTDPYQRQAETVYERLASSIPVVSKTVPERIDTLGQKVKRQGYFPKADGGDPLYKEFDRLNISPGFTSRTLPVGKKDVKLDRKQYNELLQRIGTKERERLNRLMAGSAYKAATDERKRNMIDDFLRPIRTRERKKYGFELRKQVPERGAVM